MFIGAAPPRPINAAERVTCLRQWQTRSSVVSPKVIAIFVRGMDGIKPNPLGGEAMLRVCAVQRRRFPVGASPTRQSLQPEAIGAVMEVTKWLKPSISVSRIGDSASVQAATRVNAE